MQHELDITSDATERDIESFISSEMADILRANSALDLGPGWPGRDKILALTRRAAGLFVWASTACAFIRCHDPRQPLDLLTGITISSVPLETLDRLYETALQSAGNWENEQFRSDCLAILGFILVTKTPLSCQSMDDILCLPRPTLHTIKGLGSVLRWSESDPIRILHPSFQDFLFRTERGAEAVTGSLDSTRTKIVLLLTCIALLGRILKKNICDLEVCEPFADRSLSESLSYACIYWIEHTLAVKQTRKHLERVYTFFGSTSTSYWIEAMSITENVSQSYQRTTTATWMD